MKGAMNMEKKHDGMKLTAKQLIEEGRWAPCWICETALGMLNETSRYCSKCENGFCEVHGNFAHGTGKCIICGAKNPVQKKLYDSDDYKRKL
ncbi:MAG: hypothetical protein V1764_01730 [Nitrospirota bacterium]